MKVKELIKLLQGFDQNRRVLLGKEFDRFSAENYLFVREEAVKRRVNMEFKILVPQQAHMDAEQAVVIG